MNNVGKPGDQLSNTIYLAISQRTAALKWLSRTGSTWVNDREVGTKFGIRNATFPELVAGDDNRAADAFFVTTVAGNYTSQATFLPARRGISTSRSRLMAASLGTRWMPLRMIPVQRSTMSSPQPPSVIISRR